MTWPERMKQIRERMETAKLDMSHSAYESLLYEMIDDIPALLTRIDQLEGALRDLCNYVEANKRYIPLRMGSVNTGALTQARAVLNGDADAK